MPFAIRSLFLLFKRSKPSLFLVLGSFWPTPTPMFLLASGQPFRVVFHQKLVSKRVIGGLLWLSEETFLETVLPLVTARYVVKVALAELCSHAIRWFFLSQGSSCSPCSILTSQFILMIGMELGFPSRRSGRRGFLTV